MFQDMIDMLTDKQKFSSDTLSLSDIHFLLDQIVMHTHYMVAKEEITEAFTATINSYFWLYETKNERKG